MNAKLRENSILAAEQQAKLQGTQPKSQINHLNGAPSSSASLNLTDQDKQLSENFIHQGLANRVIQENCTGDMVAVCNGQAGKHKFMGMDPGMMKAIAQAYAMFGTMGGDSFLPLSKKPDAKEAPKEGAQKETTPKEGTSKDATAKNDKADGKDKDKQEDYCKYIPSVTEGIATFQQMNMSKELQQEVGNGDTAQRDALLKAAKSHDSRAKQAQMQAMGWYGGAACYVGVSTMGSVAMDKNLIIKMGAATLLGTFYQNEVSANKEYADKMRKIADQLPGKGDCNPITDKACYCAQPETMNDPQYCMTELHKKTLAMDSYRVACTDDHLKIDPTCNCESRNACFDSFIAAKSQGAFDFGFANANSPFKSIRSFSRGELEGGTLNSKSYDRTAAIAKRGLNELGNRVPAGPLSLSQKQVADAYVKRGIPANVAALMAQNSPSQGAVDSAMAKLNGMGGGQLAMAAPGSSRNNVLDFSGGAGLGTGGVISKKTDDDLASKLKIGGKSTPNSKVLEFAARAEAQASKTGQIRRVDDRPLFEIISSRYQLSGRKLLEVEGE